jgi:hypothetical protein
LTLTRRPAVPFLNGKEPQGLGGFVMAIYHCSLQNISRADGRSAIAAAAYRSTTLIVDRRTGVVCDYTRKERALAAGIELPEGAPRWAADRAELWNRAEEKENRKNSILAYELNVAIPCEITGQADREKLIMEYARTIAAQGVAVDWAIHAPNKKGDQRNYHAHLLFTTRTFEAGDWSKNKLHWNKFDEAKDRVNEYRKNWEICANQALKELHQTQAFDISMERKRYHDEYGSWPRETEHAPPVVKIDRRTLEAQGIDREPQQHQGVTATQMERRGVKPERTRIRKTRIPEFVSETWRRLEQKIKFIEAKQAELVILPEAEIRKREADATEPKQGYDVKAYLAQIEQEQERKLKPPEKQEKASPLKRETREEAIDRIKKGLETKTPEEIAAIKAGIQSAEKKAVALAALSLLDDDIRKKRNANGYKIAEFQNSRPRQVAKSKGPLNLVYSWRDDNGREYTRYKDYAAAQQGIIDKWKKEFKRNLAERDNLASNAALLENAKEGQRKAALIRNAQAETAALMPVYRYAKTREQEQPELYAKIKTAAAEKLKTAPEFESYRRWTAAIGQIEEGRRARHKREIGERQRPSSGRSRSG